MKRITKSLYKVSHDEKITLVFTPFGVGPEMVAVSLDGDTLDADERFPDTPTYQFRVTETAGAAHVLLFECSFPGKDVSPTARFELVLRGSLGGDFTGPTVMAGDELKRLELDFNVV